MWLNIPDTDIDLIVNALRSSKGDRPASKEDERIATKIEQDIQDRWKQDRRYIDAVETDDELEIDPDTVVSAGGDPGAWVMAWVWISDEQAGIKPEDEDE